MTKEQLQQAVEATMINAIKRALENSPVKNSPFEGIEILKAMDNTAKESEEYIKKNQNQSSLPLNDEEIKNIVKKAYQSVHNYIFEE